VHAADSEVLAILLASLLAKCDQAHFDAQPEEFRTRSPDRGTEIRSELLCLNYAGVLFTLGHSLGPRTDDYKVSALNLSDLLVYLARSSGADRVPEITTDEERLSEANRFVYAVSRFQRKIDDYTHQFPELIVELDRWGAAALGTSLLDERFPAYRSCWGDDGIEPSITRIGQTFARFCRDQDSSWLPNLGQQSFKHVMEMSRHLVDNLPKSTTK